ncbi:MAG: cytochrome b5 domain-containing protein [Candidatus Shapirobacteria bacterium]|jgi:cytochrome b involved in lipid metabolism
MKKIPLLFLISITIFAIFMVFSILKTNNNSPVTPSISQNSVTAATACIITINNQKYDVTQFKNQHSGGDIFVCGSDMTTIFNSKHSQRELNMMQQYLVK